jgi:DNA-binding transcriptional ArsR family regulator
MTIVPKVRSPSYNEGIMPAGRTLQHPPSGELRLEAVLHALSDPVRLRIVAALADEGDERACGALGCHLAKSTMTHHFKVLRESGVIAQRDEGTARLNRLRRADLDARFPGLLDAVLAGAAAR